MIPSLARASSFGVFFFWKIWRGFLREGKGQKATGGLPGERAGPAAPGAHLDGCTGTGMGPGRLWYMRMMLPISLLGAGGRPCAGLGPPPGFASWAGSASAFSATSAPPRIGGFFTTRGGGGGGDSTNREERKFVRSYASPESQALPHLPTTCTGLLFLFLLLLLLLPLGDLHLGWRLHYLHLVLLLPCKCPDDPVCHLPPGLPIHAPGQATQTQGSKCTPLPLARLGQGPSVCVRSPPQVPSPIFWK